MHHGLTAEGGITLAHSSERHLLDHLAVRVVRAIILELSSNGGIILCILAISGVVERSTIDYLGEDIIAEDRTLTILDILGIDIAFELSQGSRIGVGEGNQFLLELGEPFGLVGAIEGKDPAELSGGSNEM